MIGPIYPQAYFSVLFMRKLRKKDFFSVNNSHLYSFWHLLFVIIIAHRELAHRTKWTIFGWLSPLDMTLHLKCVFDLSHTQTFCKLLNWKAKTNKKQWIEYFFTMKLENIKINQQLISVALTKRTSYSLVNKCHHERWSMVSLIYHVRVHFVTWILWKTFRWESGNKHYGMLPLSMWCIPNWELKGWLCGIFIRVCWMNHWTAFVLCDQLGICSSQLYWSEMSPWGFSINICSDTHRE